MMSRSRTKVRQGGISPSGKALFLSLFLLMTLAVLTASVARSQTVMSRVGLSASADEYVETLEVIPGEEFTLYVCIFGPGPGQAVDQPFTSLSWVIHQVCCGAEVDIIDFEFNPDLVNVGHPLVGVDSSSENCYEEDSTVLATLTCTLANPTPGGVLWAAGPYDACYDCQGGNVFFEGMAVTIQVDDDVLPVDDSRWGSVKAMYR